MSSQRFSEAFLAQVKQQSPIEKVAASYGIKLHKCGNDSLKCCCPFHDDNDPSMVINTKKQLWNCFSGCGGGDVFSFIERYEGLNFVEVVKKLANEAGIELPTEEKNAAQLQADKRRATSFKLLGTAAQFYQATMLDNAHSPARSHLARRSIPDEIISRFQLGASPAEWSALCSAAGGYARAIQISAAGLAVYEPKTETTKAKLYDRFRNRLMFPIRDVSGRVVSFGARTLTDEKPKYINGPETDVFKKGQELFGLYESLQLTNRKPDYLVVTEGYIDVIRHHAAGLPVAVAPMGTAVTSQQLQKALRYTGKLYFAFDGDAAGTIASTKALKEVLPLATADREFYCCSMPADHDPDSYIRDYGADKYLDLLGNSMSLANWIVHVAQADGSLSTVNDRAQFAARYIELVNMVPPGHLKDELAKRLDSLVNITPEQYLPVSVAMKKQVGNVDPLSVEQDIKKLLASKYQISESDVSIKVSAPLLRSATTPNQRPYRSHNAPLDGDESNKQIFERSRRLMQDALTASQIAQHEVIAGVTVGDLLVDANDNSHPRLKQLANKELFDFANTYGSLLTTMQGLETDVAEVIKGFEYLLADDDVQTDTHSQWATASLEHLQHWQSLVSDGCLHWQSIAPYITDPGTRNACYEAINAIDEQLAQIDSLRAIVHTNKANIAPQL
ncbi:DNA primase [Marinobacterium jannaschii]|uniref:DNA primase n=1 Tax=Marinobacterium jannaschii TaxID=64970 RepID=UPI00055F83EA|nr:DNA primase [Marinobacterium jannaschii]